MNKILLHPDEGIHIQITAPEKSNQLITELKKSAEHMTLKLKDHPEIESAWLTSMAFMESTAAYGIKKSITDLTPKSEIESILNHYSDEMRHADQLLLLRKSIVQSENGLKLQENLCSAAKSFTYGFFLHPTIQEISSNAQYAGYVHAALTIEQIPFQMYSNFYLKSKGDTKKALTLILKDEHQHLKLGKRLYQDLEEHLQFPVDTIQMIEMGMCLELMTKINLYIDQYIKDAA